MVIHPRLLSWLLLGKGSLECQKDLAGTGWCLKDLLSRALGLGPLGRFCWSDHLVLALSRAGIGIRLGDPLHLLWGLVLGLVLSICNTVPGAAVMEEQGSAVWCGG